MARATAGGARLVDGPAANPVLRGAYEAAPTVPTAVAREQLGSYAAGTGILNLGARIGATQQGRNVRFDEREKKGLAR